MELSSSITAQILPEIENDPQKMNSASLNMKLFSVIILIAPTQMGNKKNCVIGLIGLYLFGLRTGRAIKLHKKVNEKVGGSGVSRGKWGQ